jgi:hypothetical protein
MATNDSTVAAAATCMARLWPRDQSREPRSTGSAGVVIWPQAPTKKMPPQPVLPPYERAAMRACGSEWQDMKLAGAADGRIWRDFAAECLRRRVGGR